MNIIEAAKLMKQGYKVRLKRWADGQYFFDYLDMIRDENNEEHELSLCDVLDQDWEVYEKSVELFTFEQALTALKNGKKIRRQSSISDYHLDKVSSRILETYNCGACKGETWWGESFSDKEILAEDWIILNN